MVDPIFDNVRDHLSPLGKLGASDGMQGVRRSVDDKVWDDVCDEA